MRAPPIPKIMLPHTIVYRAYNGTDDFGSATYGNPVTIDRVRFDETTVFSRDGTQNKIVANGVIFIDAVNSAPFLNFEEQSLVIFNSRELVVQKVIPCYQPFSADIHHYELEVI